MTVNGQPISWKPPSAGTKEGSLVSFAEALVSTGCVPKGWMDDLDELLYCLMKSLSFQYALMDVLAALQEEFRLKIFPTIPTEGMRYDVTLRESSCEAKVLWPKESRIFTLDPDTGVKKYIAAVEALSTTFRFPIDSDRPQNYQVNLMLPRRAFACLSRTGRVHVSPDSALFPRDARDSPEGKAVAGDRSICSQAGCRRYAARGRGACCRTCVLSGGSKHGDRCEQRNAAGEGCSGSFTTTDISLDPTRTPSSELASRSTFCDASPHRSDSEDDFEELFPASFAVESASSLRPSGP